MPKIGLALSGGGVRSLSQLPVISALANEKIKIDAISGTSMGSVVAALFATGIDEVALQKIILELADEIERKKILSRPSAKLLPFSKEKILGGFIDGQDLENVLQVQFEKLGVENIRDVKIPLAIPAVDIITGKTVMFVSHPELYTNTDPEAIVVSDIRLSSAVRASCSFPFVISAMPFENYMLVDGGVRKNLPLEPLYDYKVDKTIAVTMHATESFEDYKSLSALGVRIMDLMRIETDRFVVKNADVHINIPMDKVWVFEIDKRMLTLEEGERVIKNHIQDLRNLTTEPTFFEKVKKRFLG